MLILVQENKIREFFKAITGNEIRDYQLEAVMTLLQTGKHLIFKAPTGAGKTPIGLTAFLYDYLYNNSKRYDRLIYSLPRTSLVNQVLDFIDMAIFNLSKKMPCELLPKITVQTGERPEDPHFTADIVVTTDIQLLSRYANIPIGTTTGTVNIGTGALIGSLIVVDESHLLEPGRSMGTMLDLARRMQPYTQVLLMTATFSDEMMAGLQDLLGLTNFQIKEVVQDPVNHRRELFYIDHVLDVTNFLKIWSCQINKTIVMFNTVNRARQFYRDLLNVMSKSDIKVEIELLHSYFLQDDRKQKLKWIHRYFGADSVNKKGDGVARILVTTQVIEVGVDISADILFSELSPASSLIQRVGRCARFNGQEGKVYVFALLKEESNWWLPYKRLALERTLESLAEIQGKVLNLKLVNKLVNQVHNPDDQETFDHFDQNLWDDKLLEAFSAGSMWFARELIRANDTIPAIVFEEPSALDKPWSRESLPLSIWNLAKLAEAKLPRRGRKGIIPLQGLTRNEEKMRKWMQIKKDAGDNTERSSMLSGYELVCVAPEFAKYSYSTGFELCYDGTGGGWQSPDFSANLPPQSTSSYNYRFELLSKHLLDVANLAEEALISKPKTAYGHRCRNAVKLLAREFDVSVDLINDLAITVCLAHDVAKGSANWQKKAWAWQCDFNEQRNLPKAHDDMVIGHTDVDSDHPWVKDNAVRYRRPPHAMESAVVTEPLIVAISNRAREHAEGMRRAALMAITKHHNANTQTFQNKFQILTNFIDEFAGLLREKKLPEVNIFSSPMDCPYAPYPSRYLLDPRDYNDAKYLPVYWLLVRILRLADWGSQITKV